MIGKALGHEIRSYQFAVQTQPEESTFADGDVTILCTLAAADEHRASGIVDVPAGELDEFVASQAARIENFKDGAIPKSQRFRH